MTYPVSVSFRDMSPSEAVEAYARQKANKLGRFCDSIVHCRVLIAVPQHRHQRGDRYEVRIELAVPADELVASRKRRDGAEELYACIDGAFDDAQRLLQNYAARRRAS